MSSRLDRQYPELAALITRLTASDSRQPPAESGAIAAILDDGGRADRDVARCSASR